MAAIVACERPKSIKKLILLAPAIAFPEFEPYLEHTIDVPVIIYHGKHDDVVPVAPVRRNAQRVFENLTFIIVDDDHVLSRTFKSIDWDHLLETQRGHRRV